MNIRIKYVVYELNSIMGNQSYLALEETELKGWANNEFNSEEEAIQALINDEKTYEDYIILKQVHIRQ